MWQFGPADLAPHSASAYAWRWRDPGHTVLSADVVAQIRAVAAMRAEELFRLSTELDRWVHERPDATLNAEVASPRQVQEWLEALERPETPVVVVWGERDAILAPWRVIAAHWDVFWYPSSDDASVIPATEKWSLSWPHWGVFMWRGGRG